MQIPQAVKALLSASRPLPLTARCCCLSEPPLHPGLAEPSLRGLCIRQVLPIVNIPLSTPSFLAVDWAEFLCLKHLTPAWILQSEADQTRRAYYPASTPEAGQPHGSPGSAPEGLRWASHMSPLAALVNCLSTRVPKSSRFQENREALLHRGALAQNCQTQWPSEQEPCTDSSKRLLRSTWLTGPAGRHLLRSLRTSGSWHWFQRGRSSHSNQDGATTPVS